jgi:RNA polymerase sigma-70 factor, ECF subfamily
VLLRARRWNDAIAVYRAALEFAPDDRVKVASLLGLGDALAVRRKFKEAREAYLEARKIFGDLADKRGEADVAAKLRRLSGREATHQLPARRRLPTFQVIDEQYVEALRNGDPETEQHFGEYFSELIRLKARVRLRSPDLVEDVTQETLMRVLSAIRRGSLDHPERLGAFVNSVCNNVMLELARHGSRTESMPDKFDAEVPADREYFDVAASVNLENVEHRSMLRDALSHIPQRDRELLQAIYFSEKDVDQVCREYHIDRSYIRVLLHRARSRLRAAYERALAPHHTQ